MIAAVVEARYGIVVCEGVAACLVYWYQSWGS